MRPDFTKEAMVWKGVGMRRIVVNLGVRLLASLFIVGVGANALAGNVVASPDWAGVLHWRLVGPFRGGWATMAVGVPTKPNTFYFGAADGGVWKTTNAGRTWRPLMQHEAGAAVGALAVAASNSKILYVGTGQVAARYDIVAGDGVYRSSNAGRTWAHVGLTNTQHIGKILIDPHDPNRVLVAALGNVFSSSHSRGVYLTTDGGKHWRQVLYVNNQTGAVDLAWDPDHPRVVYAATWQMRMHPWLDYFQPQAGPGSGIWKSVDGGLHWRRLRGHGLPSGPLGRIGIAVARGSDGRVVYASIAVPGKPAGDGMSSSLAGGLYRSTDGGASWVHVNASPALDSSYFGRLVVSPSQPDRVFVMGRSIHESTDGGKHFFIVKGAPGGDDYHFLWINPDAPNHWVTAADQGCAVTVDAGKAWSSWYNQPTGQFYHIAVDNRFPFWIYGGQQDSGTVAIESRGWNGVIGVRNWHSVGGDERDYEIPEPGNPNLVFGSGLGGYVSRYNQKNHQVSDVSPWPVSSYGAYPRAVRYRYTWITPIAFGPGSPPPLYLGSQVLFRSVDGGQSWTIISPDLTGAKKHATNCHHPDLKQAQACGFGVIYTIATAKRNPRVIWIGTDDGMIWRTSNSGRHWTNVTPRTLPTWGRVDAIALSPTEPGTAYVAVDVHRLGKHYPLIYKTTDNGQRWQSIVQGIPAHEYVLTVATDGRDPSVLFAGTNRGVDVSYDAGKRWQPFSLNLPTVTIRDLAVHDDDLIAATQGRGIWILDDLTPLSQLSAVNRSTALHLFQPAAAVRLRASLNQDTPPPPATPLGKNPPTGAVFDYFVGSKTRGPIVLTIRTEDGQLVRRFSSQSVKRQLPANRYFQKGWVTERQHLSSKHGYHRFVWNLRYPHPKALQYHYSIAGIWQVGTPRLPDGPMVLPGPYEVTLSSPGHSESVTLRVLKNPERTWSRADLLEQFKMERHLGALLSRGVAVYKRGMIESRRQSSVKGSQRIGKLDMLLGGGGRSLHRILNVLSSLYMHVEQASAAPTSGERAVLRRYEGELTTLLGRVKVLER